MQAMEKVLYYYKLLVKQRIKQKVIEFNTINGCENINNCLKE